MSKTEVATFTFPRPLSPTKDDLKPNPHPYAIKTTSTGLLSRSNSSPHHANNSSHNLYIPSSPSPTSSKTNVKREEYRGHRYSRSLSTDLPRPLPLPPSPSPTRQIFNTPNPRRSRRSETLPTEPTEPGAAPFTPVTQLDDLPPNPKRWTPSQLSSYLSTALRVRSGETLQLPTAVARDIAGFVRDSRISGKSFLRLCEEDLEQYGINKLWRQALLSASRTLRQNVLKGNIWGFSPPQESSPSNDPEDEDSTPNNHPHRRRSRSLAEYDSPDPFAHDDPTGVSASPSSSPFLRMAHRTLSNAGRVRGMVENLNSKTHRERSGSVSSSCSSAYTEDESPSSSFMPTRTYTPQRPLPTPPVPLPPLSHPVPLKPNTDPTFSKALAKSPDGEEMSIEDLLMQEGDAGVHAWETDILAETVKRLPPTPGTGAGTAARIRGSKGKGKEKSIDQIFSKVDIGVETDVDKRSFASAASSTDLPLPLPLSPDAQTQTEGGQKEEDAEVRDLMATISTTRSSLVGLEERMGAIEQWMGEYEGREKERERELQHAREQANLAKQEEERVERQVEDETKRRADAEKNEALRLRSLSTFGALWARLASLSGNGGILQDLFGVDTPPAANSSTPSNSVPSSSTDATAIGPSRASQNRAPSRNFHAQLQNLQKLLSPQTLKSLPAYVLLVSLGMCVVVVRVVGRSVLRRRSR